MNIYAILKSEHREMKELLKELTDTIPTSADIASRAIANRRDLLFRITAALELHDAAEEKVFYSRLTATPEARVLALEGKDEHVLTGVLLKELAALDEQSDAFAAKAKVLRDFVELHIKMEEGEIHPQAKRQLSSKDAIAIGEEFNRFKEEERTRHAA